MKVKSKRRFLYILLAIISFAICVLIVVFFSQNQIIRGFVGDVVIIFLLYFLAKAFYDASPLKLSFLVLLSAFIVEFMQYFRIIEILGLGQSKIARIVIGSVFDPLDLLAYLTGAILVYVLDGKLICKLINKK